MAKSYYLISFLILILLLIGGYFLWLPQYQEYRRLKVKVEIKEERIRQDEEYLKNLNFLSRELEKYDEAMAKIGSALPSEFSIPAFFHFMQKTSSENGLILNSISFPRIAGVKSEQAVDPVKTLVPVEDLSAEEQLPTLELQEIQFSISLSGHYPSLKNFLSALYRSAKMIDVVSIGFSSPTEDEIFTFALELKTYAFQPKM